MLEGIKHVHLIGIGGIGVSGVARALLAQGFTVSGSDVRESSITTALRHEGADVTIGHDANLIDGCDLVVFSTAIPDTNPELVAARARDVPLRHRAEVLGSLLDGWRSVGVIGTHGKGTVSAMTTAILEAAEVHPSFIIGGILQDYHTNTRVNPGGENEFLVVEIDESDGSLVRVRPDVLVVNNLEADHLNYYGDLEAIYETVGGVLQSDSNRELAVLHVGDTGVRELRERLEKPINQVTVGFADDLRDTSADIVGSELVVGPSGSKFTVHARGKHLGQIICKQPGRYNAMNALVAAATGISLEIPFAAVQKGLARYSGIENRFTVEDSGGVRVIKDYISHPTGIRRVLEAARTLSDGPITAIFKPYRFTMIHYLGDEYAVAFKDASHTVITELYTAGEVPIPGVDAPWLIDKIRSTGSDVVFVPKMEEIVAYLLNRAQAGEQFIFFGGDDLFQLADHFIARLGERECRTA
jgi:UDP-N-acetylmuramate--alanine ligase